MIGVDQRFAGNGFGGDILVDALARIAAASEALGIAVVMLDVLDCGNAERTSKRLRLYKGYGFAPLPTQPLRLFLPVATVRSLLGSSSTDDNVREPTKAKTAT